MAESEELKRLLMEMNEESEKVAWKLSIQKLRSWHLVPSLHGKWMGKQWKQWQTLFWEAPKSLLMVTAAMKLKDAWKESYDKPRQHIKKQRYYFANKGPSGQGYSFSSGHVWMRVGLWRKLRAEILRLLNLGNGEDSWEFLGLQGDPTSPS